MYSSSRNLLYVYYIPIMPALDTGTPTFSMLGTDIPPTNLFFSQLFSEDRTLIAVVAQDAILMDRDTTCCLWFCHRNPKWARRWNPEIERSYDTIQMVLFRPFLQGGKATQMGIDWKPFNLKNALNMFSHHKGQNFIVSTNYIPLMDINSFLQPGMA